MAIVSNGKHEFASQIERVQSIFVLLAPLVQVPSRKEWVGVRILPQSFIIKEEEGRKS